MCLLVLKSVAQFLKDDCSQLLSFTLLFPSCSTFGQADKKSQVFLPLALAHGKPPHWPSP